MSFNFNGRHVIITGGAGTLGTAVTELLIESGASCSVPCFNQEELDNFKLKKHSSIFTQPDIDLSNEGDTQDFYQRAIDEQGRLWASIHIAGGFGMGSIDEITQKDFMKQINMNLVSCFNSCKEAIRYMSDHGGRIVNIASRPALEPRQGKGMTAYTTSKAGVATLTQSLAAEVVNKNILVNAIAPSTIDTPQNRDAMPGANYDDWPKPRQLAEQILYLTSPVNEITRGAVIPVYGQT